MRWLTHVEFPTGANILGLLELFAWIGGLFVTFADFIPDLLRWVPMLVGTAGVMAFDLVWRFQHANRTPRQRLLFPSCGGCILFVPLWLVPLGFVMVTMLLVVLPR